MMVAPVFPFVALKDLSLHGVRAFAKGDGIAEDNAGIVGTFDEDGEQVREPEWEFEVDYAEAGSDAAEEIVTGPQRPGNSASKAAWVDYAAALLAEGNPLGIDAATADGMTREKIIEHIDGQAG